MKKRNVLLILVLFSVIITGCDKGPYKPEGTIAVQELLEEPVYNEEIQLYGQVTMKGVTDEGCFEITYIGKNIKICELTDNFNNGDMVIVTGKYSENNKFVASAIKLAPKES